MKYYGNRDTEALGEHYMNHLNAMTEEGLHSKADIAAELAIRDMQITMLAQEMATVSSLINKVTGWAAERNLILGSTSKAQTLKLGSEFGELCDSINKGLCPKDDIGDMFVVLIILCAQKNLTVLECLSHAYDEIKDRKGIMIDEVFIKDTDPRYPEIIENQLRGAL